ncbi:AzlD domain-containing protein [Miltoncostaea marina]|uniref:AzlD domain-containing protein n=1 Tax=Miltoncostaea marina TaxID=2843215 RepID=UPI001C3D02AD|nr:AzlD domain-containing protein [Miltoncostaea marina]
MSWTAILALAAGTYALKAAGPLLLGGRELPGLVARVADLLPAALLAALVATQGLTADGDLTVDARAAGVAAALVVAWRRGSFLLIVAVAMAVTALVRALA